MGETNTKNAQQAQSDQTKSRQVDGKAFSSGKKAFSSGKKAFSGKEKASSLKAKALNGPGSILAKARKESGMQIKEVAEILRLRSEIIVNIESDIRDDIIGPTFTRGYLRSYARLMAVSDNDIISRYNEYFNLPAKQPAISHNAPSLAAADADKGRYSMLWVGLGLVLILTLALGTWYGWRVGDEITQTTVAAQASKQSEKKADKKEHEVTKIIEIEITNSAPLIEEQPIEDQTEVLQPESALSEIDQVLQTALTATSNPEPSVVFDLLELSFSGDCWVIIEDSTGKRLSGGLMTLSQQIVVEGVAPFSILLGDTQVVTLKHNDNLIDVTSYAQQGVARFSLP